MESDSRPSRSWPLAYRWLKAPFAKQQRIDGAVAFLCDEITQLDCRPGRPELKWRRGFRQLQQMQTPTGRRAFEAATARSALRARRGATDRMLPAPATTPTVGAPDRVG